MLTTGSLCRDLPDGGYVAAVDLGCSLPVGST
jgi:hypothetical protein